MQSKPKEVLIPDPAKNCPSHVRLEKSVLTQSFFCEKVLRDITAQSPPKRSISRVFSRHIKVSSNRKFCQWDHADDELAEAFQ